MTTTTRRTISRKTEICPHCGAECKRCGRFFSAYMDHIAAKGGRYTTRVVLAAVDLVIHQGMTLDKAAARMREKYQVRVPPTTLHDWLEAEHVGV